MQRRNKNTLKVDQHPSTARQEQQPDNFSLELSVVIVRGFLLLAIFFILHYLFQLFVFEPLFRPKSSFGNLEPQILTRICPDGASDCAFDLDPNWKQKLKLH